MISLTIATVVHFNSYMVRLRDKKVFQFYRFFGDFNSYMVRLRALVTSLKIDSFANFNSYMVRLRGAMVKVKAMIKENFNSYMVRLRVLKAVEICLLIPFQFLHGAIKGPLPEDTVRPLPDFNSYMVRLRVQVLHMP